MKGQKSAFKEMKVFVELICLMISSIVGVGFLTGLEIFQSFAQFGKNSIFGLSVLFFMFFALTYKILSQKTGFKTLLKMQNIDKNMSNNTSLTKLHIKNQLVFLNVFLMSSAMFSGLKTLINNLFFNNYIFYYLAFVLFIFFALEKGVHAMKNISYFVVAFLLFVLGVVIKNINGSADVFNQIVVFKHEAFGFKNIIFSIISAMLYVFMNIVQIQPVIDECHFQFSKKKSLLLSLLFSLFFVLSVAVLSFFLFSHKKFCGSSMPVFELFKEFNNCLKWMFVIGLLLGLFSTLLSCLTGVKRVIQNKIHSNLTACFLSVLFSMIFGCVDFSFFVSYVYPIVGVINIINYVFL